MIAADLGCSSRRLGRGDGSATCSTRRLECQPYRRDSAAKRAADRDWLLAGPRAEHHERCCRCKNRWITNIHACNWPGQFSHSVLGAGIEATCGFEKANRRVESGTCGSKKICCRLLQETKSARTRRCGRANSLVLRSTQAALAAAKGSGYVVGHSAGRMARECFFPRLELPTAGDAGKPMRAGRFGVSRRPSLVSLRRLSSTVSNDFTMTSHKETARNV